MANLDQIISYLGDKNFVEESGNNYIKFTDGTLIQWGSVTIPANTFTANWTHPVPFKDRTNISIQVTPAASITAWNINYGNSSISSTNVGRTPNTAATAMYIFAVGKWK